MQSSRGLRLQSQATRLSRLSVDLTDLPKCQTLQGCPNCRTRQDWITTLRILFRESRRRLFRRSMSTLQSKGKSRLCLRKTKVFKLALKLKIVTRETNLIYFSPHLTTTRLSVRVLLEEISCPKIILSFITRLSVPVFEDLLSHSINRLLGPTKTAAAPVSSLARNRVSRARIRVTPLNRARRENATPQVCAKS